jgi:hypothetical protein
LRERGGRGDGDGRWEMTGQCNKKEMRKLLRLKGYIYPKGLEYLDRTQILWTPGLSGEKFRDSAPPETQQ